MLHKKIFEDLKSFDFNYNLCLHFILKMTTNLLNVGFHQLSIKLSKLIK